MTLEAGSCDKSLYERRQGVHHYYHKGRGEEGV